MSLVSGLLKQKVDTISSVTVDGYGDKEKTVVYKDVPCRWQEVEGRIHDRYMKLKDYNIEAWLFPQYEIFHDYVFTKDSVDYKIVRIVRLVDLAGNIDHIKVYLI